MRPRRGGDEERVLSHGDVVLLRCDLTILRGPHFLKDRVIAFYLSHLSSSLPQTDGDHHLLLLPPSIPYLLSNLPDAAAVAEPLRLASRRLPVNDNPDVSHAEGGSHWTLLVLDNTHPDSGPRFVHHDSLPRTNLPPVRRLAAVLRPLLPSSATHNRIPLIEGPTPRPTNGYDCGVFVLAVARAICHWWTSRDQDGETDWFEAVKTEVNADSVNAMRTEVLQLIDSLIQGKKKSTKQECWLFNLYSIDSLCILGDRFSVSLQQEQQVE